MEYLRSSLSRSFMDKEYKNHQKTCLLAEAEARVGDYQDAARRESLKEDAQEEIKNLKEEIREAKQRLRLAQERLYHIIVLGEDRAIAQNEMAMAESSRADFFMACPRNECRGRISTGYKCGLCDHFFCAQCHACKGLVRDVPHECNKDDVDTVKALRENTKRCPNDACRMLIFKESGCDQMWCTSCHTCFSWRSGQILRERVHNPHFYEYQRRNGGGVAPREPGDIPCGGLPYLREVQNRARRETPTQTNMQHLYDIHRVVQHLTTATMPRIFVKFNQRAELHRTTGILYLRGKMTRDAWRDKLYMAVRQEEKFRRYYQLLEMFTMNIAELLRHYVAGESSQNIVTQCVELFEYTNTECTRMKKQFNMTLPTFSPMMDVARI